MTCSIVLFVCFGLLTLAQQARAGAMAAVSCISGVGTSSSASNAGSFSATSYCVEPPGATFPDLGFAEALATIDFAFQPDGFVVNGGVDSISVVFVDEQFVEESSFTSFSGAFSGTLTTAGPMRAGFAIFSFLPVIFGPGGGDGGFSNHVEVGAYSSDAFPLFECTGDFCGFEVLLPLALGTPFDVLFEFDGFTNGDFAAGTSQISETVDLAVRFVEADGLTPVAAMLAAVPEPTTISLLAGALIVGVWRQRRRYGSRELPELRHRTSNT